MDRSGRQLRWVQQNCSRRDRSEQVGATARTLMAKRLLAAPAWRRDLLLVLEEHAGDLLDRVAVDSVRAGVLRLTVREPAHLHYLRLQWEQRLLKILGEHLPAAGIHRIRFAIEESSVHE